MAFKDLSRGNENVLTSSTVTGDVELRSPAGISLYPDSNESADDRLVWLRDNAKLVFEGPISNPREIKIQAPEPTGTEEDAVLILPTVNGTFALESFVLEEDALMLLAAANYTDTEISTLSGELLASDANTLNSANNYTDSQISSLTSYVNSNDTSTLSAANSYTDSQISALSGSVGGGDAATLSAANNYTDSQISSLTSYIDSNDSVTLNSANSYTDSQNSIVLSQASADASAKANAAISSANAYTDMAEASAVSTANAYTDNAESSAVSAARIYTDYRDATLIGDSSIDGTIGNTVKNRIDTAESDAVATANTYTDTQVTKTVIDSLNIQAASVDANSVALGTDTTGNYVASVSGTLNEIEVSGSGSETASVTVGLPSNVSVTNDLTVGGDLFVTGTTVSIGAANLSVDDSFIYLNQGDAIGADNTTFTGTGLDDASFEGYFEGTTTTTYYARIDGTGATDTFEWSKDNFATTEATGIAITGGEQDLDDNIKFHANATTGHTLGDVWSGTAAPLAIDTGIFSNVNSGTAAPGYTHVGVFYDASATRWKVFSEYDPEPNGDINTDDASFVLGAMEADCFIAREVDITSAPTVGSHATTKTYVDGIKTALELYADNGDTASIATANSYTDSQLITQQTQIDSKLDADHDMSLTLNGDVSGTATFTNMANATLTVVVADDSHTHDGRYYTESEANSRFINTAGDTMTGTLTIGTVAGASGTLNVTGDIVATGDVTAYSDARFKRNVKTIDNSIEKVKLLRGVYFDKDGRSSTGVIAQEIEEVLPEVVHTNEEGLKSVAYGNTVGLLIEAIKDQQKQIEELKLIINQIK